MFSFGEFFGLWARLGWNFSTESREERKKKRSTNDMEYIKRKKEECFSLSLFFCVCVFAAAPNRRHYFVKVCRLQQQPVILSAGFLHLI